jgi:hypothetical protein
MLSTYALVRSVLFVQPVWPFATLTLYLERRREGAKDPHGSFARLHAAPVLQRQRLNERRVREHSGCVFRLQIPWMEEYITEQLWRPLSEMAR